MFISFISKWNNLPFEILWKHFTLLNYKIKFLDSVGLQLKWQNKFFLLIVVKSDSCFLVTFIFPTFVIALGNCKIDWSRFSHNDNLPHHLTYLPIFIHSSYFSDKYSWFIMLISGIQQRDSIILFFSWFCYIVDYY